MPQYVVREAARRMLSIFSLKAVHLPPFDAPAEVDSAADDDDDDADAAPLRYAWSEPAHHPSNKRAIQLVTEYVLNHGIVLCSKARIGLKTLQRDGIEKLVIKLFGRLSKNFNSHQLVTAHQDRLDRALLAGVAQADGMPADDAMQVDGEDAAAEAAATAKMDKTRKRSKNQARKKRVSPLIAYTDTAHLFARPRKRASCCASDFLPATSCAEVTRTRCSIIGCTRLGQRMRTTRPSSLSGRAPGRRIW